MSRTRFHIVRAAAVTALLIGPLLIAGCDKDDYGLVFSHYLHVEDNGLECADCHGEISGDGFRRPDHDTCADCHEGTDADEISEETCGVCHREQDPTDYTARGLVQGSFVHGEGLEGQCTECHGNLLVEGRDRTPRMDRGDVVVLRDRSHAQGMDCALCHVDMDPNVAPQDHERDWMRRHGQFGVQGDAACGACHAEDSCRECHSVMMPSDHNTLFRTRTHGIESSWDRERCLVCHETDSCTACHEQVRPRSHNAAWSRTHCYECHTSAATGQGCVVCHQDGMIETHPNPHSAGWRDRHCDTCHPGTPEARQCELCHPGGFEAHPNPHGAGWRGRHCDSCHPGSPQADECRLCHETTVETHPNPHRAGWRDRHCFSCHQDNPSANDCDTCHPGGNGVLVHQSFWPPVHDRFGDRADCYYCHTP